MEVKMAFASAWMSSAIYKTLKAWKSALNAHKEGKLSFFIKQIIMLLI